MIDLSRIRQYVKDNSQQYVERLRQACAIQSVSTEGDGFEEMTAWLTDQLQRAGASVSRLSAGESPDALVGEIKSPGGGGRARTLMIYDHYDVQPVDPIELWESPPFELTERGDRLFARGAADNKGDLVARLCALDIYKTLAGEFPFDLKFFIEGEEESGSVWFEEICRTHAGKLAADDCVWEGAWFDSDGRPAMFYGCKGLLYVELTNRRLSGDQHSSIAGYAPSAAWELVHAVASLRNLDGSFALEGLTDQIVAPGPKEKQLLQEIPFNEQATLERLGIEDFQDGLSGHALKERLLYSPTINIAGFSSGYSVPGATKTVLPAEAMAKLDFRLVPGQDAKDIAQKLRRHLDAGGFGHIELKVLSAENPSRSPMDSDLGLAAEKAAAQWFAKPCVIYPFMWATGPMHAISEVLGIPVCSPPGVGRPDSNLHAPNENCRLEDFLEVIGYTVSYLAEYGKIKKGEASSPASPS